MTRTKKVARRLQARSRVVDKWKYIYCVLQTIQYARRLRAESLLCTRLSGAQYVTRRHILLAQRMLGHYVIHNSK